MPSETLVVWTDPALPALVEVLQGLELTNSESSNKNYLILQPPAIQPNDKDIPEGGSMTIFCLALGNPVPTISLYIGGHLVRQGE